MSKVFLCMDGDSDVIGEGTTLKEAYDTYIIYSGADLMPEALTFYEAEKVEVEVKIQKKEVVTKITAK